MILQKWLGGHLTNQRTDYISFSASRPLLCHLSILANPFRM